MNTIDLQRAQYIRDCKTYYDMECLKLAYERIYEVIPEGILKAIKEKTEEFKLEDENEIL